MSNFLRLKYALLSTVFCSSIFGLATPVDPFSKVVITSLNASCTKDHNAKGLFIFQYRDNVRIMFADNSSVTADFLEITFDGQSEKKTNSAATQKLQKSTTASIKNFKKIVLKNNVCIQNAQRKATADSAELFLAEQRCLLDGNVKIWQFKQAEKDIPVTIQSQKAALSLRTGEVKLLGSAIEPVCTTIVLEGHPSLKNKRIKNKNNDKRNSRSTVA